MSGTIKNKVALAALAIFTAHKNIDEIYMTSDGQGFTEEEKAKDNARYHRDQTIQHFERGFEDTYQDDDTEKTDGKTVKTADDVTERQKLAEEYEEVFGKKPHHSTGIEKLKTAITEKRAELAAVQTKVVPATENVKKEGTQPAELATSNKEENPATENVKSSQPEELAASKKEEIPAKGKVKKESSQPEDLTK